MKKEWVCQLVLLVIFYLDSSIYVEHEGVSFSETPVANLVYLLYHALLFLGINYVLIPRFFYTGQYGKFFVCLVGAIILFGVVEEAVVERILSPDSRGTNDVTWQSIYWFFGEILVAMLAFITVKIIFDNFEQQQQLERIEQDRLSNELRLLKSQIQPHILFNSLNNLYHFALKQSDEVPGLILKLSNVLRYVLYEATDEKVALKKELAFLKDYVDLQEIQYGGRGEIHCDLARAEHETYWKVEPFLLIPFVENGFKHSFGTKIKDVFVNISVVMRHHQLSLRVENNYEESGTDEQGLVQGGIGLVNVRKRLELLYPDRHELTIRKEVCNYVVDLSIELT